MNQLSRSISFLIVAFAPALASGTPVDDANAVVDRWSAAYSSNDTEAVVRNYAADAILLGTVSPVMSVGTEAIRTYFSRLPGSGRKNVVGERRSIPIDDNAVLVAGYYEFSNPSDSKALPRPSRFTMLVTRRDGAWRIAHYHSSTHVLPAK